MLFDQLAFDEALDVCLRFQEDHGDTLIVVTTDHGNSNPALNGAGSDYGSSAELLGNLRQARCSFDELGERLIQAAGTGARQTRLMEDGQTKRVVLLVDPAAIRTVLQQNAGYDLPEAPARGFARYLAGDWQPLYSQMDSTSAQLGQLMANHYGIGWAGTAHTSDHVQLIALGPGADRFGGFLRNTDIFRHYTELAGIRFKNPELPLMADCRPSADEVEAAAWS
jgi:alkaline phosphatase